MENLDFYRKIRVENLKALKCFSRLSNLYNLLPKTKGCMENICTGECCKAECCRFQTPQLLYCEFLKIWKYINKKWDNKIVLDLFEKCMKNAVDSSPSKGCVFFDDKTYLCLIHKVRSLSCRVYGITPPEEFNPRYERLKEYYKKFPGSILKPQCTLVSTEDNSLVTIEKTSEWWNQLVEIEEKLGINKNNINDREGGSYRSPHDHILLYTMPDNILNALSGIKLYNNWMDKLEHVAELMMVMREYFKVL